MLKLLIVTIIVFLSSCRSQKNTHTTSYKEFPLIEFCEVPNHASKKVFTRAIFSGMMEYWSLSSPDLCNNGFTVGLDFNDNYANIPSKFKAIFNRSHSYKYIIIEAVGIFETGRKEGYGHLGSNNSKFTVFELVDVKGVSRYH